MRPSSRFSLMVLFCLGLTACAAFDRGCSSFNAQSFGADWVIVQMDVSGRPFRCWELHNRSVSNETQSDGIYWIADGKGNLVHISGFYNRVQVVNSDWDNAYREVGLTKETCAAIHNRAFDPAQNQYK